jgi:glycosyltransferase involved in cell wall biosynthesis
MLEGLPSWIVPVRPRWSSPWTDHLWEQVLLPGRVKGHWLFSPSTTGPLRYERQVVTVHDVYVLEPDCPERGLRVRWFRWLLPRLLPHVPRVITVSHFARRRLLALVPGIQEHRVAVIHHGVDLQRFSPGPPSPTGTRGVVLSVVSTLAPHKGVDRLHRFAARLHAASRGRLRLRVVGGLPGERMPSGEGLEWMGYVPPDRIPELYRSAFAFVYLSRYDSFGFPVLEAMASGLPVLTSGVGGIPEIQGDVGIRLAAEEDMDRGIRWLLDLLDRPGRWEQERSRSRARAMQFPWSRTLQKTRDLLEQVVTS